MSGEGLSLGPPWLYPLKASVTRCRSFAWALTGQKRDAAGARILFYHRVSTERDPLAVRPARFREQMSLLAAHGYRGIDVEQLGGLLRDGRPTSGLVGLSFDDGYLDVVDEALPVLAEHGFSASVFVATAVTSGTARFAWYTTQPPLIPWARVAELDRDGVLRFEAHTRTHPNLVALDEAGARVEIAGGKAELEERLGRPVDAFCYPAGLFGERERRLAAEAGFRTAVSCEPGVNTRLTDPLALHRIQIDSRDSRLDFRAKLLGGHDTPSRLRTAWRRRRYGPVSPRAASSSR